MAVALIKILHLQTDTGLSGGIAHYIAGLLKSTRNRDLEYVVVVPGLRDDTSAASSLYGDAQLAVLPPTYSLMTFLAYIRDLRKVVNDARVDIIHAHALRSALAAALVIRRRRISLVYTNHGLRFTQKSGMARAMLRLIEAFVCRRSDFVCCIRRSDVQLLSEFCDIRKVRLIRTQIEGFLPQNKGLGEEGGNRIVGELRFIGVGSLIPIKRPDYFVNFIAALEGSQRRVSAIWLGEGPLRTALRQKADLAKLRVEFPGAVGRNRIGEALSGASFLLITSDYETMPLSVLEAYSCGTPVIIRRTLGVEDYVIDGKTGIIVDGDAGVAASKIVGHLENRDQIASMRKHAYAFFLERASDPQEMTKAYGMIYRRARQVVSSV